MKLRLKNKQQIPYGYWRVKDRMTGQTILAVNWEQLLTKLKLARKANGIPVGLDFENEVEQWAAQDHPDEATLWDSRLPKKVSLGMKDIIHGTKVMAKFRATGKILVDREEAERRADICSRCAWNVGFSRPCSGICQELKNLVVSVTGNNATRFDDKLNACFVCKCFLKSAVWIPLETQCVGVTEEMRSQFDAIREQYPCWKNCSISVDNPS